MANPRLSVRVAALCLLLVSCSRANQLTPRAYWSFNGNAQDAGNHTAHLSGTATFVAGIYGSALNASTGSVSGSLPAPLKLASGNTTLAMWLRPSSLAANATVLHLYENITANARSLTVEVSTAGVISFRGFVNSTQQFRLTSANGKAVAQEWVHVAVALDAQQARLFVGGQSESSATLTASSEVVFDASSNQILRVGSAQGGTAFSGLIDELLLYNVTLSATEVSSLTSSNCSIGIAGSDCSVCRVGYGSSSASSPDCATKCPVNGGQLCSGNGTCTSSGTCTCSASNWGADCSNACPTLNGTVCNGRGSCVQSTGNCSCSHGFAGTLCEKTCPMLNGKVCNDQGTCDPIAATCRCNSSHTGALCELACPVNQTACAGHGTCELGAPFLSSNSCSLPFTYNANQYTTCTNVDASSRNASRADDYWCSTSSNFTASPTFLFCEPRCDCSAQYRGAVCEHQCPGSSGATTVCSGHGNCAYNTSTTDARCTCANSYGGLGCEKQCPQLQDGDEFFVCSGHGKCLQWWDSLENAGTCQCDVDRAGSDCSIECPKANGAVCNGKGLPADGRPLGCNSTTGQCLCDTTLGFWGQFCNQECKKFNGVICNGRGVCLSDSGNCECAHSPDAYYGEICTLECPRVNNGTRNVTCNFPYGRCIQSNGNCQCDAKTDPNDKPLFTGSLCQYRCPKVRVNSSNTDDDLDFVCNNQGTCGLNAHGNASQCTCNARYVGARCQHQCPTGANNAVCNGQGTCKYNATGDFAYCECNAFFVGSNCTHQCPTEGGRVCNSEGTCQFNQTLNSGSGGAECICESTHVGPRCHRQCPTAVITRECPALASRSSSQCFWLGGRSGLVSLAAATAHTEIWNSTGIAGVDMLRIYRATAASGHVPPSDVAVFGSSGSEAAAPARGVLVGGTGVAAPLRYEKLWDTDGTGAARPMSLWQPIAPDGYVCLGAVASTNLTEAPSTDAVRCVRFSQVASAVSTQSVNWNATASGSRMLHATVRIGDEFSLLVASDGSAAPTSAPYFSFLLTRSAAAAQCDQEGGALAQPESAEESTAAFTALAGVQGLSAHIGLMRSASGANVTWSNSTALNYTNWASGEPGTWALYGRADASSSGAWRMDANATLLSAFLCEKRHTDSLAVCGGRGTCLYRSQSDGAWDVGNRVVPGDEAVCNCTAGTVGFSCELDCPRFNNSVCGGEERGSCQYYDAVGGEDETLYIDYEGIRVTEGITPSNFTNMISYEGKTAPPPPSPSLTTFCTFPFVYNGKRYYGCTTDGYHRSWCSKFATFEGFPGTTNSSHPWFNCTVSATCRCQDTVIGRSCEMDCPYLDTNNNSYSVVLDGVDDYVDAGQDQRFSVDAADVILTAWFRASATDQDRSAARTIFATGGFGKTGKNTWAVSVSPTTNTVQVVWNENVQITGSKLVNDSQWHNVIFTRNGTRLWLYVDGALDNNVTQSLTASLGMDVLWFGRGNKFSTDTTLQGMWKGNVDEISIIVGRYMLAADAARLYQLGRDNSLVHFSMQDSRAPSSTIRPWFTQQMLGYWRCGGPGDYANKTHDRSRQSTPADGTLKNGAEFGRRTCNEQGKCMFEQEAATLPSDCVFPFRVGSTQYTNCTSVGTPLEAPFFWCPTVENVTGYNQSVARNCSFGKLERAVCRCNATNVGGLCQAACPLDSGSRICGGTTHSNCSFVPVGATDECTFPFIYRGNEYRTCIANDVVNGSYSWCSRLRFYGGRNASSFNETLVHSSSDAFHVKCSAGFGHAQCNCTEGFDTPSCGTCTYGYRQLADDTRSCSSCPMALSAITNRSEECAGPAHGLCNTTADQSATVCECGAGYFERACTGCLSGYRRDAQGRCLECPGAVVIGNISYNAAANGIPAGYQDLLPLRRVCSGQGECSINNAGNATRCFCEAGYRGWQCNRECPGRTYKWQGCNADGTNCTFAEDICSGRGNCSLACCAGKNMTVDEQRSDACFVAGHCTLEQYKAAQIVCECQQPDDAPVAYQVTSGGCESCRNTTECVDPRAVCLSSRERCEFTQPRVCTVNGVTYTNEDNPAQCNWEVCFAENFSGVCSWKEDDNDQKDTALM